MRKTCRRRDRDGLKIIADETLTGTYRAKSRCCRLHATPFQVRYKHTPPEWTHETGVAVCSESRWYACGLAEYASRIVLTCRVSPPRIEWECPYSPPDRRNGEHGSREVTGLCNNTVSPPKPGIQYCYSPRSSRKNWNTPEIISNGWTKRPA